MKFKDLFDKEVVMESTHVRKELKIFYELNLKLIKPHTEEQPQQPETQVQSAPQVQQPEQQIPVQPEIPVDNTQLQQPAPQPEQNAEQPQQDVSQSSTNSPVPINDFMASVVTEDDKLATETEEKIERKFSGEIKLSDNEKDNIQTIDDIIEILSNTKKDGTQILDEFSSEMITLCTTQNYQQIKEKLDKKSKIFVEIYYGYSKFDSIGLRFNKHENADTLTSTMLLDNNIINAKFSIDKINQKIADFRNYEADRHNK